MCGIAGFVGGGSESTLKSMADRVAHRGPDDEGYYFVQKGAANVGLASRRLAILDLSPAGHMPMTSRNGRFTIVYNGETYNYQELKRNLETKGHTFDSNSDTEVVLYLYQEFGARCVQHLRGMFAFAIWDNQNEELFVARDHFGIKPFYYYHRGADFVFASEVKALLVHPSVPRALEPKALDQYLTFLWVPDPLTMFKGVLKLPAAHCGLLRNSEFRTWEYWDLNVPEKEHLFKQSEEDRREELRLRWHSTVKSQLRSDVPVGCFLSAGLDSSSILSAMHASGIAAPSTYTISFPRTSKGEITLDDTAVAARTAARFGCKHHNIMVEPSVTDLLPKVVWHMDEPIADPAAIMAFLVSRAARPTSTVLFSGVGGDELFAGYRKYQAHFLALKYQRIPSALRRGIIEPGIQSLPSFRNSRFKGHVRLAKKMARSGSLPPMERFLTDSVYLSPQQKHALYSSAYLEHTDSFDPFDTHCKHFAKVKHADFLNQMLYVDLKTFTVSLNLTYNDKMSMASSVEVRVPFLDSDFAEWVFTNVPPSAKLRSGVTKYILRESLKNDLPSEVLKQKKAGFGAPIDNWICNEMRDMVLDLLGEEQTRARGIFNPEAIRAIIERHRSGAADFSLQIWQLLTLELWLRTFIDR